LDSKKNTNKLNRVLVLGCCGSGKSTFSKRLAQLTSLPIIHLDQHYWKANWVESTPEEWEPAVKELANGPSWIMDGNYASSLDVRLEKADTVIYLDQSTLKCLWRITRRILKYRGQTRPDMPEGCYERFDLEFYHYVAVFNLVRRKKVLDKINKFKEHKLVQVFGSDKSSEAWLNKIALEISKVE